MEQSVCQRQTGWLSVPLGYGIHEATSNLCVYDSWR